MLPNANMWVGIIAVQDSNAGRVAEHKKALDAEIAQSNWTGVARMAQEMSDFLQQMKADMETAKSVLTSNTPKAGAKKGGSGGAGVDIGTMGGVKKEDPPEQPPAKKPKKKNKA